jgi:hypothetical protein
MGPAARILATTLGACLIAAGFFGIVFGSVALDQTGHTMQGYSCREPPQNQECTVLENQALFWNAVRAMSAIALVAGPVLVTLVWARRAR